MVSVDDLKSYNRDLLDLFTKRSKSAKFNNDRSHNAIILCFMLEQSLHVNMFCGELSILRNPFYKRIEEVHGEEVAKYLKKSVQDSLESFFGKDGSSLSIVLENNVDFYSDLICKETLQKSMIEGKVSISVLPDDFTYKKGFNHFSFTESKIVRLEEDKIQHNAVCMCNGEDYLPLLTKYFQTLKDLGSKVDF